MVARTVEYLKDEQIGNICLFADADGKLFCVDPPNSATCEHLQPCRLRCAPFHF